MNPRNSKPPERLTNFVEGKRGKCHHCYDGIVNIMRHPTSLELMWDCCICALCGQRYYIISIDKQRFLGYNPDDDFNG
jgi:hypothetical protein